MKEITLRIKNDQLAENFIALVKKIKEIEIFEEKKGNKHQVWGEIKDQG